MKKKFLALLLAFVMAAGMLPMTALADTTPDLTGYNVLRAGIADSLPEEFGIEDAPTDDGDIIYVQLNKEAPENYTIILQVFEGEKPSAQNGGIGSFYAESTGTNIIYTTVGKLNRWYYGTEGNGGYANKDFSAFGNPASVWFFVGVAQMKDGAADMSTLVRTSITPEGAVNSQKTFEVKTDGTETKAEAPAGIGVTAANLTAAADKEAPAYGHATEYKAEATDKAITVTAEGLEKTTNTNGSESYWVGVGLTYQEGATYDWNFGDKPAQPTYKTVDRKQTTNQAEYTTLYWSQDTQAEWTSGNKGYISVKYANGVVVDYTVTFNVAVKDEGGDEPTPTGPDFTAAASGTLHGEMTVDGLQTGTITVTKDAASGKYAIGGLTLKKITTPWTDFNGTLESEQTGFYVVFAVPKIVGENTVTGMKLPGHAADGTATTKEYTSETTPNLNAVFTDNSNSACYVIMHVGAADATVSAVKNKEFTISLKYGDDADYTDYTFVCSGVTPEGAAADPTPVTPPSGGGSTGGGSNTTTTTNPDGSTTTKTEDKATGTVTETTKKTDGSTTVVETKKDGTVTTTDTDAEGNKTATVAKPDGSSETKVSNTDGSTSTTTVDTQGQVKAEVKLTDKAVEAADSAPVALPMPEVPVTTDRENAPTVTVSLPGGSESVKVEIPVENVTPGSVAVIVKADGTEEVVKTSVTTENGVAVTLSDGDTVKIVDNSKQFDDVPASHWGSDAVGFASSRELFNGTSETTFSPDTVMTRGMLVTVLARFDGADTSGGNTWYDKGVEWAVANNISDGSYPHYNITREQMITMLWRYAGSPAVSGTIDSYTDAGSVSSYSVDAMNWAVSTGLISGTGSNSLSPQGNATRAQVAALLMHYVELLAAK